MTGHDAGLTTIDHPIGFQMTVANDWAVTLDPRAGVLAICVDRDEGGAFRSNHVVTVDELPDGLDLETWQDGNEGLLGETLQEYWLLDREVLDDADGARLVRLAHHAVDGSAVTFAQVAWIDAGRGMTLTSSVSTLRYPGSAAHLGAVLESFRPSRGRVR